jgi:septal ring factor EnvC (AmiA/AmiB activator)
MLAIVSTNRYRVPTKEKVQMNVVRNLALGLLLASMITCVAVSAPPQQLAQNQPSPLGAYYSFPYANVASQQPAQLAKQYVDSKKEDEKRSIRKELTNVLTQQFDHQIQEQQKELDDLEKQIANLRSVLKKRLEAKSTIIDRRIEQLIQDAEGLGWNAPSSPHYGVGYPGGAYVKPGQPSMTPALRN